MANIIKHYFYLLVFHTIVIRLFGWRGMLVMYKVIVIDDEEQIRDGLKMYIETMGEDFAVCADFESGEQAIEYLKNNDADVVITDIRMANITGIDVIRFIFESKPMIKTVLITAFEEFEYAKYAVEYHVEKILVKPTNYDEFVKTMQKIKEELDKNKSLEQQKENIREYVYKQILAGEEDEIDVIGLLYNLCPEEMCDGAKDNSYQIFEIYILNYDYIINEHWQYEKEKFYECIKNILRATISEDNGKIKIYEMNVNKNTFQYLACVEQNSENDGTELEAYLKKAKENFKNILGIKIDFSVKRVYDDIQALITEHKGHGTAVKREANNEVIAAAKKFIEEHYSEDISLYDVARYVNMNGSYFSRFFKQKMGVNFLNYLTEFRINKAKEIIREGDFKVSDLGLRIGYKNPSYFGKIFKEVTGYTPRNYYLKVIKHE